MIAILSRVTQLEVVGLAASPGIFGETAARRRPRHVQRDAKLLCRQRRGPAIGLVGTPIVLGQKGTTINYESSWNKGKTTAKAQAEMHTDPPHIRILNAAIVFVCIYMHAHAHTHTHTHTHAHVQTSHTQTHTHTHTHTHLQRLNVVLALNTMIVSNSLFTSKIKQSDKTSRIAGCDHQLCSSIQMHHGFIQLPTRPKGIAACDHQLCDCIQVHQVNS